MVSERIFLAFGWACLGGVVAPLGLVWITSIASPPAETLIPLFSFSVGSAALGLLACGLAFRRKSSPLPIVLGILLLVPASLSTVLLADGLRETARGAERVFCMRAEREGRTVRRGEAGYKVRLDEDRDGLACEPILGPTCYQGRCIPFG